MGPHVPGGDALTEIEVRRRFAGAVARGQPGWLWPDIDVEHWRDALCHIEAATRAVLAGAPSRLEGNTEALGLAGYTSGLGPLLGWWIESGRLEAAPAAAEALLEHLTHNRQRAARLTRETLAIVDGLARHGVTPTLIKGAHTAHVYFPEPGCRPQSDIDLLIDTADEPQVDAALSSLGYQPAANSVRPLASRRPLRWPPQREWRRTDAPQSPRSLRMVHAEDPWAIDVQSSLNRRSAPGVPMARLDAVVRDHEEARWPLDRRARVLPQPLLILHLAVHASCDFGSLSLLRQVEIVEVVRRDTATGALCWNAFIASAQTAHCLGFAYPALLFASQLAPDCVPPRVLDRLAASAPPAIRAFVSKHTPATIHAVDRWTAGERYLWSQGTWNKLRQLLFEATHGFRSPAAFVATYRRRLLSAARRVLTRPWAQPRSTAGRRHR